MFQPFPTLHTERLILRQLTHKDAADMFLMRSDPDVMRFIPRPLATSEADMIALIDMVNDNARKGEGINWGIEWKATGVIVGMIGYVHLKLEHFRAEVGYSITRAWHRKGIASEALMRVIAYGFQDMNLHSIEAIIDAENHPSGALLEHVGFKQEAFFREDFFHAGAFRNSIHYGLLKS